ncbi:hypothetical protein C1H46_012133 [Malus baccata]|uniref:Uncharacterized protein n=1 Tax=Malus baccata TaxID=106549 RepID=A0A540MU16_MALBA|nr:hypothetical protein C1H46_012133 [Malus baccata]
MCDMLLGGTLVLDSANKVSENHVLGSRNGKFKYFHLHVGATTFEPSYGLGKNSWDLAVAQRVYDDVVGVGVVEQF